MAVQLAGLNSRAKKINLQLNAIGAIDDVADIDRFPGIIDDDQMTLNSRRAERDLHKVSNFWTGAADQQGLVRIAQRDVVTGINGRQGRGPHELLRVELIDATCEA